MKSVSWGYTPFYGKQMLNITSWCSAAVRWECKISHLVFSPWQKCARESELLLATLWDQWASAGTIEPLSVKPRVSTCTKALLTSAGIDFRNNDWDTGWSQKGLATLLGRFSGWETLGWRLRVLRHTETWYLPMLFLGMHGRFKDRSEKGSILTPVPIPC